MQVNYRVYKGIFIERQSQQIYFSCMNKRKERKETRRMKKCKIETRVFDAI